ncbi:acyl carrier protein [Hymenobacter edaphi]|uniref:acyl carrier protein n=1 Tax=Hymenobacter edaphi TaxID=2211146 RepID=UPI001A9E7D3B|nr:acyl carrier protein [Hymenobacter edaphi]
MGLDTVELIDELEAYFGLDVPDREAEQMSTVQQLADGVCRLRGGCDAATPSPVRQHCLATLSRELQAALRLAHPPTGATPLAALLPATAAHWRPLLAPLATRLGWDLPAFTDPWRPVPPTSWLGRLFGREPQRWVDWRQGTVDDLVDWTAALNYRRFYHGPALTRSYDVLRAVCSIVGEKSGVDIWEIRPSDSITYDLGMD